MHSTEITNKLNTILTDYIIQDIITTYNGYHPADLAPLCGRLITGVRTYGSYILILLEPPLYPDEPHHLLIPTDSIRDISRYPYNVTLHLTRRRRITIGINPMAGRLAYTIEPTIDDNIRSLFAWAFDHNDGRICLKHIRQHLGATHNRAFHLAKAWVAAGWLSANNNHQGRLLTPAARAAMAREVSHAA